MQRIAVFVGPSGVGKSSIVSALTRRGLVSLVPTWTTRPRRADEVGDRVDHVFVDEVTFAAEEARGGFLATAQPFGLAYRYGLPRLGRPAPPVSAVILRASLLPLLSAHVREMVVYQFEADPTRVQAHLRERERQGADARQESYEAERDLGRLHAHRIIVNHGALEDVADHVASLLQTDFPSISLTGETAVVATP